ncbi:MAG: thiamine phosphate synthase [Intestinibacter sp.]
MKLDNDAIKKSMLLYAITDRGWLKEGETLESVVEDVLKSGATFLQLREKIQGHEEIVKQREIFKLFAKYNVPFVVNDDIMAAKEIDADGVHIGQSDMEYTKAREILGQTK